MAGEAKLDGDTCAVCGTILDPSLADLGCTVCSLGAGLETGEPDADHTRPERFGSYTIALRDDGSPDELGRGAMGITFRALDTTLNRPVALKIIDPRQHGSDRARERFMREARAAAGLRHQNVAAVHHFGVHDSTGQYFYAMELVEGETLEERVRRAGPLKPTETIVIAQQVVAALAAAEKRGLIHRDLKPGNIMLVSRGDAEAAEVKVIDFGLAKAVADEADAMTITRDGFVGSPAFASPEQFANARLDVRSDIFSLGVTLWFALTGRTPFAGRSVEEIQAAQQSSALPTEQLKAARVPARLIAILTAMLRLEAAARPGAAELGRELERQAVRKNKLLPMLAAAAVLLGLVWFAYQARAPVTAAPTRRAETQSPEAREAFLKGRHLFSKRSPGDLLAAETYLERAIALDPNYAQAYAALSDTCQFIANSNRQVRAQYYAKAKEMSRRAIELDPTLAEPHASLGLLAMNYEWDWPTAEREFKRAIALNPNYATAHHWYAFYLNAQGRFDEALAAIERARQLDPLSSIINTDVGQLLVFARRYSEAEEKLKETLRLDPTFDQARSQLAGAYIGMGRYDEALAALQPVLGRQVSQDTNGNGWTGTVGYIYGVSGRREEAEKMLAIAQQQMADPSIDQIAPFLIYVALGRKDEALDALEDEYRWRSTTMTSLRVGAIFDSLRSDPRFGDILRRVGL